MASLDEKDEQLITWVRSGDTAAFAVLYSRHSGIAEKLAAIHADNFSDASDVAAVAFASVLERLPAGNGPDVFFRAYLLTVVRCLARVRNRSATRTDVVPPMRSGWIP